MPIDPIVELASQLQAFISTKHPFTSELDPAILQSIESCASPSTSSLASISQERRSRSDARPLNSSPYLVEWADTRTHLRSAVWHFERLLKHRTALGSTSATSESYANSSVNPINSTIIEELALPISTTILGSSNSSIN